MLDVAPPCGMEDRKGLHWYMRRLGIAPSAPILGTYTLAPSGSISRRPEDMESQRLRVWQAICDVLAQGAARGELGFGI